MANAGFGDALFFKSSPTLGERRETITTTGAGGACAAPTAPTGDCFVTKFLAKTAHLPFCFLDHPPLWGREESTRAKTWRATHASPLHRLTIDKDKP